MKDLQESRENEKKKNTPGKEEVPVAEEQEKKQALPKNADTKKPRKLKAQSKQTAPEAESKPLFTNEDLESVEKKDKTE